MVRLVCRHMFHLNCWRSACGMGPSVPEDRRARGHTVTCPNCRGRGHAIACWHWIDPAIITQVDPVSREQVPNIIQQQIAADEQATPLVPTVSQDMEPAEPGGWQADGSFRLFQPKGTAEAQAQQAAAAASRDTVADYEKSQQ